jgi:hypothetical protein
LSRRIRIHTTSFLLKSIGLLKSHQQLSLKPRKKCRVRKFKCPPHQLNFTARTTGSVTRQVLVRHMLSSLYLSNSALMHRTALSEKAVITRRLTPLILHLLVRERIFWSTFETQPCELSPKS